MPSTSLPFNFFIHVDNNKNSALITFQNMRYITDTRDKLSTVNICIHKFYNTSDYQLFNTLINIFFYHTSLTKTMSSLATGCSIILKA